MSDSTPPISYTFEVPAYSQVFVAARPRRRYWLHILLLLLTLFTTLVVGARLQDNFVRDLPAFDPENFVFPLFHLGWIVQSPARLVMGLPFSLTLLGILLAHEFGHFFLADKNGVYATLPYFIPAPTFIGTFGALIRIKSPIRSRKALFDIGIAGPIAGFLVAVPVLFWGLALSKPMPPGASHPVVEFGYPLIFKLVSRLLAPLRPHAAPLGSLYLHPVAVAAWVGMFATALNLLPGGQLDGGHITYAVSPRAHKWVTRVTIVVLIVMGRFWPGWWIWALILGFTGMQHPNVPKWPDIGSGRRWLALLAVLMLALTVMLTPVQT
ncbi:MAG: site-2 protease family protein [Candidatus Korobacteraceae bacterium]